MRKYILIAFTLIVQLQLNAQDIIILKSGDRIEAKVLEIDNEFIKYRLYTQLEGPDRKMDKSRIQEIIYEDGQFDVFEDTKEEIRTEVVDEEIPKDFFRTRNFVVGIIGASNIQQIATSDFYDPITGYTSYEYSYENLAFIQLGFKFGMQRYFGSSEKFRSGLKIDWFRLGIHIESETVESILVSPRTFGLCNLGYAGLLKINDDFGVELNMVSGLGMNAWIAGESLDFGVNFTPEIRINLKNLLVGVEYSYYLGIDGVNSRPINMQMLALTIGTKFK